MMSLAGYPVRSLTAPHLNEALGDALQTGHRRALFFANTNFIVKCRQLRPRLREPDVLLVNDGIGMDLAARMVHGRAFPENLNGTDFIPAFLRSVGAGRKTFLIGGKPGIAAQAGRVLNEDGRGPVIVGSCDGYDRLAGSDELIERINASGAEIVLVAMGNPIQEEWILQRMSRLDARVFMGVGALFDFLAGDKPRAPDWVRRLRFEWLYRLYLEPRRLLRRYTVDVLLFFALCLRGGRELRP